MITDKNRLNVLNFIKFLFSAGLIGIMVPIFLYYRNNFFISPIIEYIPGEEKDTFSVQADFRGITMRIYPQMLICYDSYVILVTHLDHYYDQEFIHITDKTGYAEKKNQEDCDKLMQYIRDTVLQKLKDSQGEDAVKEINGRFRIYISLIGGVQYENKLGNEIKKYCIIEQNGLVTDYDYNADEIISRLYENEIVLGDDIKKIGENAQINQMIEVVTNEVNQLYERVNQNNP